MYGKIKTGIHTTKFIRKDKENRVISMALYGSNPRYTKGAVENAKLIRRIFPGWKLRIYLASKDYPATLLVPRRIIDKLQHLNVDLFFINSSVGILEPRMWRFLVANDNTVDRFIIRDADSRLIPRECSGSAKMVEIKQVFPLYSRSSRT